MPEDLQDPHGPSDSHAHHPPVPHLALKVRLLLLLALALLLVSALYLLYARGVFEPTQTLVLTTDDSEGVTVGMDMTFQGFPIGRVRRVALGAGGEVRIIIDVARKDAHWLRTGSVFTLVRSLVGATALRAYTGVLSDPPLPDGAERQVLRGDATADIPRVMASARDLLENLTAVTAEDAPLRNALARTNALLARADQIAAKADAQFFGPEGLVPEARQAVTQVSALLVQTRGSLRQIDVVLQDAQAVSGNLRDASADLGAMRAEVDANLRKIEGLINEINRRWPFARDPREAEVKLP